MLILWSLADGIMLKKLEGHDSVINDVKFDGVKIISGDESGIVKVWDAVNNFQIHSIQANSTKMSILIVLLQMFIGAQPLVLFDFSDCLTSRS